MGRVGGYMRVSRVGDRDPDKWLTIPIQRDAIKAGCKRENLELVDLREDIDVSGGSDNRPNLEQLVQRIERGELDGLVVSKLDRFSRDLVYGGLVIQRIEKAGGLFLAADDGVKVTADRREVGGDETRLQLDIMLSLASYQLRRFRSQWAETRRRTIAAGVHWGPTAPLGYKREKGSGQPLQIDPPAAAIVREIFTRTLGGQDRGEIMRWLDKQGIRTGRRGHPTHRWIRSILTNRVYLGEAYSGEHRNAGAHEAIVDVDTFDRVQDSWRLPPKRNPDRDTPMLSGLLRCFSCSRTMTTGYHRGYAEGPLRGYRCRKVHAHGTCPAPAAVMEHHVLPLIETAFWQILDGDLVAHQAMPALPIDELRATLAGATGELVAYRDNTMIAEALDAANYTEGLHVRQARVRAAQTQLEEAIKASRKPDVDTVSLREQWEHLANDERRRLLQATIGLVAIKPAESRHGDRHLDRRARLLLVDDLPADLPRSGRNALPVAALPDFDDPACPWIPLSKDLLPHTGSTTSS